MSRWIVFSSIGLLLWLAVAFVDWGDVSDRTQAEANGELPEAGETKSPDIDTRDDARPRMPSDRLLAGYGDPTTEPLEDLRKLQRVILGYFSVVKNDSRFPIGGNADLSAALLGENVNRLAYVREGSSALDADGLLVDRWGQRLFVHPEAARELTLRSAGPDGIMFTDDDVVLLANGARGER